MSGQRWASGMTWICSNRRHFPEGCHAMGEHVAYRCWVKGSEIDSDVEGPRPFELVEAEALARHVEGSAQFVKLDVLPLGHVEGAVGRDVEEDRVVDAREPSPRLGVLKVEGDVEDCPM